MKASLLTAGALVCTLASLASARPVTGDKQLTKSGTSAAQQKELASKHDPRLDKQDPQKAEQARAMQQKRVIQQQLQAAQQGSGPLQSASVATAPGTMMAVLPPANDACASASAISGPGPHAWTNVTATTDGPSNCGIMTKDVWYNWTSGAAGNYTISLCAGTAASVDTVLTVYSGAGCPVGASLDCDDDFCAGFGPSEVVFTATAATVYKIQIGVYNNGAEGSGTFTVAAAPPAPANDLCAAATAISGTGPHAFTNVSALLDGPSNCGTFTGDVWYNWTAGATGNYHVETCGQTGFDTQLSVYATSACQGTHLGCNDQYCANESRVTFSAVIGNVYKIQVGGWNGQSGTGTFTVTLAPPAPGNDLCTAATAISGPGPHAFTNVSALTDGPSNCGIMTNDVWYNWTSGAAGNYIVSLCAGATMDSVLSVYTGAGCPVGAPLGCDDDGCGGVGPSRVVFTAAAASVYKIQIGGYNGTEGSGTFTVAPAPPAPGNDLCTAATAISGPGPHAFTNVSALTDGPSNCGVMTNDVWYNWTSGAAGPYEVTLCSGASMDTVLSVYTGAGCPVGTALDCDDDFCAGFGPSKVVFTAAAASVYKIQLGGYNGAEGSGTFLVQPPPPPPANDLCSAFTAISGPGPHNFDNTTAITGTEGQTETLCDAFGSTSVENDIWYRWTAGSSGQASLSTCGQTTVDTKIGVYPGTPACPTNGSALGCNDDSCGLQSVVCWPATSGQTYTIQLGTFPGALGGTGTFSISVAAGNSTCQADDGSSEDALGWTAGGEMGWLQRFGPPSGSTSVSSVQISWGTAAFPGGHPPDGSPAKVLLYEDPNNDGIPNDLVLVQQVNTTVANVDTDTFNTVAVTPVSMNGYFFAGGGMIHSSGQFVAPMDTGSCHPDDRTYFFGDNTGAAVNYNNPQSNIFPPDSMAANGFACNLMVRAGCNTSPFVGECFPGTGGVITCPCPSQAPANPNGGCANHGSGSSTGVVLSGSGVADVSSDTLVLTASNHRPAASVLNVFFSYKPGTATPTTGLHSGAGVRCTGTGGSLKRLYTANATGGTISKPGMGDLSISAKSATFAGHAIVAPETRHYFNVYRDGQASLPANCNNTLTTTNLTNMGAVSWVP